MMNHTRPEAWSIAALSHVIFALCALASCGSNPSGATPDGGDPGDDSSIAPSAEALRPHPVCAMAPAAELGKGCSAAGWGDLCTSASSTCGSLSCVIDARDGSVDAYCAPACAAETDCPLGYACVEQHSQCSGAVAGKVCARTSGAGCNKVTLPGGAVLNRAYASLFEDHAGARYLVAGNYQSAAALYRSSAGGWTKLHTWSDGTSTQVNDVKTSGATTLVFLPKRILAIDPATTVEEAPPAGQLVFGVDGGGTFVALEPATSAGYATVYRRQSAGKWQEVGPTSRKLVQSPFSLDRGFVGICGSAQAMSLCTSVDGQRFEVLELPAGASLSLAGSPATGRSTTDFFIVLSGALFHHRDGEWVKEGIPTGYVPDSSSYHSYSRKTLQRLVDETMVYGRDNGKGVSSDISSFVLPSESGACWHQVNQPFPAAPWGGALAWIDGTDKLCVLPIP
jgi:hypothetical protein